MDICLLLANTDSTLFNWVLDTLEYSFYPVLLSIFIIASLGIPIPEDIPLIAAGIMLATRPQTAHWAPTIIVSLCGIMTGDVILYSLGRRWGPEVFKHKSVSWLITPKRMQIMTERFHIWGVWACFGGRFMMGVRAIMCLTAGVTRFPFWKFFVADFCGAMLSAPLFIVLGYYFAGMLGQLDRYIRDVKLILVGLVALVVIGIVWYEIRKMRKIRREDLASMPAAPPPSQSPPLSQSSQPPGAESRAARGDATIKTPRDAAGVSAE